MSNKISNIFFDDGGVGSIPVVFVHSLAGNTQQWSAQLDYVRTTRRAVALDLRGHGQSPLPVTNDYTIPALAQDIQTVVDQLGIQRFILAGHSMGGSVATYYASIHPQRVAGLLLVDPSGDSTKLPIEDIQHYIAALESDAYSGFINGYWNQILAGATNATRTAVMQHLQDTPQETVVGVFKELFKYNPMPALARYSGPKLSIITPLNETPFSLHKLTDDLPYELITGTGHWLQMDKPDAFNKILDKFLASIGDA